MRPFPPPPPAPTTILGPTALRAGADSCKTGRTMQRDEKSDAERSECRSQTVYIVVTARTPLSETLMSDPADDARRVSRSSLG